jgi:hypothetical protein
MTTAPSAVRKEADGSEPSMVLSKTIGRAG